MSEPPIAAEQQADTTSTRVLSVLAAYEAGRVAARDVPNLAAVTIFVGKTLASRLADIELSTRLDSPPLGIVPGPNHIARLEEAVSTVLGEPESVPARLDRLAVSEVLTSHSKTLSAGIRERGLKWRENVAADACPICQPFRDVEHEPDEPWTEHHPRCRCGPEPISKPVPVTAETSKPSRPSRISITKRIA